MRVEILSAIIFILIISQPVFGQSIPTIKPYVNDFAGVLTQNDIYSINNLAAGIEKNTTVQVAVLVVNSTQPSAIEDYANQAFRQNGIGHRDNNNGLLIVVAVADKKWRLEVGYGLEGVINDAKAGDIGRTYLTSYFQQGQYGQGLYLTVQSIGKIVSGSGDAYLVSAQPDYGYWINTGWTVAQFALVIFIFFVAPYLSAHFSRCPRDGSHMDSKTVGDNIVLTCPKCGFKRIKKRRSWWVFILPWSGGSGSGSGGGSFGGGSSGGGGASGGW